MGYDNECIVNIQSLPGEYFCPVCRTLICPNEALQAQCTHLFCKPCLAYVTTTTHACSYDGYLVTEADSKPLVESNKELAETIGKVAVHCLYQRSGCQWQGTLAESTAHCMACNYGNSPVVCNRCGTQIIHRQVQEHAQICPGIQPQGQAMENASAANQTGSQDPSSAALAASAAAAPTAAPTATPTAAASSVPASAVTAAGSVAAAGQTQVQPGAVAPTPEQWYQQQQLQYQQYYQQYPGYDPYQQQYQQYAQYQQQAYPQHAQSQMQAAPQHLIPGQPQPQPYMQQPQPQLGQPQAQAQAHPQHQPQPHVPSQVPQMQAQPPFIPPQQPHPHAQAQTHPPPQGQVVGQSYPQPQPHAAQARPPPQLQPPPQHQQQMPYPQPHPQHQPQPQQMPYPQPQMQLQPQPIPQMQPSQPPVNAVSGYQSYPQPIPGPPQQSPMHMHPQQHPPQIQSQFPPQQPPQMRPSQSQMPMPAQQQPAMPPPQGPHAHFHPNQQQVQPLVHHPGMHPHGQQHAFQQPHAQGPLQQGPVPPQHQVHPQPPLRPQTPSCMQQPILGHPHQPGRGMPSHQVQTSPAMVSQGIPQRPNQNKMERATPHVSMQQSLPPHSGNQGGLALATLKEGASTSDKIGQGRPLEAGLTVKNVVETKSGEKISENAVDLKSEGDEGTANTETTEKDDQAENDDKRVSEKITKDDQVKVEEGTDKLGEVTQVSHDRKIDGGEGIQGQERKSGENSGAPLKVEDSHPPSDFHTQHGPENSVPLPRTNQGYASDAQIAGNIVNSMHHPQQIYAPGVLDGGQLQQQSSRQNIPAQAHGYAQPGYNDRNPSQFPQQHPSSNAHQGLPPGVPPHMPDPSMISQRPPAPDMMFSQPTHERRFPEPPPHQMRVHGQAIPPSQMRPPGLNVHETFSHQGKMPIAQEPFWPPPRAMAPGQALPPPPPPPLGGVPGHHGFPPKGFEHQATAPSGQAQNTLPLTHVVGVRSALGEPLPQPGMGGPPPGAFNKSATVNAMEGEAHAINRPGVYDGRQPGSHHPQLPPDALYGQPMKMNGMANNMPIGGGMHEPAFPHGLSEDRYGAFPEERFKLFPEERFKAVHDEHFRSPAFNRREIEEDLKQFPRPAHLDGEGPPKFDPYLSSSRPLDRMPQQPGSVHAMDSRPLSSGAPFPPGIGSSGAHQDIGGRDRPMALHEHIGRKHDGSPAHSDRLNLVSEFGHHRVDGLPPLRNLGNFSRDVPDGLPAQLRRGFDGLGALSHSFSSDMRGSESRDAGFGGFRRHHDGTEPRGPGFDGRFSMASRDGDMETFDQSRKWKTGSMVRCLICKIDCETVEGLDLHSHTREHQKMTMDMVLSIKKDNAQKHNTSENAAPFEQANKSRKGSFQKRTKRL